MIIKIRGDADAFDRSDELICSINQPASSVMGQQLAARLGRRSLKGLEVWAVMPDGKYKRVDVNARPCDYGITEEDKEWAVFIRSPAIPECPSSTTEEHGNNLITMQWSRHAVYKPKPCKKRCRNTPKKVYTRRLANAMSPEQQQRALTHYSYIINDGLISRDFASAVLAEVVQVHLRGRLSRTVPSQTLPVTERDETQGGLCSWVSGDHHVAIKRYLRILDSTVQSLNVDIGGRSPALLSFYPAGGSHSAMHTDSQHDKQRKLTATMFLQHPGPGGQLHMLTPTNIVEAAPLLGRVILHWSDERCRHEIRPTGSQAHYSITVWYYHADGEAVGLVSQKDKLKRMALMYALGRACVGGALAVCGAAQMKGKKRRRRKKKKKTIQEGDSGSDSDDNWAVWCAALRAALASSLSVAVSNITIPQPPLAPLESLLTTYRHESVQRRQAEAHMAQHEEAVEEIMCSTVHDLNKLAIDAGLSA